MQGDALCSVQYTISEPAFTVGYPAMLQLLMYCHRTAGNATGGGSQLAALEAPCSVRVPPGPTFSRMSGNAGVGVTGWSLWDRSSHGPVEGGPPGAADVPVGLGTGGWGESSDVAVAVVPCSSGAAICPDHALAAPVSDAPWAQPITPGADDDDIAALYAGGFPFLVLLRYLVRLQS